MIHLSELTHAPKPQIGLTPRQLDWCRSYLRVGNILIFRLMEETRSTRVRAS